MKTTRDLAVKIWRWLNGRYEEYDKEIDHITKKIDAYYRDKVPKKQKGHRIYQKNEDWRLGYNQAIDDFHKF